MKKYILIALTVLLLILLVGCKTLEYKQPRTDSSEAKNGDIPLRNDTDTPISDTESHKRSVIDTSPSEYISEEEIKSIVLTHADLTEDRVKRYNIRLDYDDDVRRYEYEISFYADKYEYDYEVDALTGDIINFDKEHIFD